MRHRDFLSKILYRRQARLSRFAYYNFEMFVLHKGTRKYQLRDTVAR